ncbi:MAG: hypothetical protein LBM06_08820 [Prevotellaceae bacterium]|jgi:hypothetical protein|nr:hypothetical protein [Prevotellaceae bacterium]
MKKIPLPKLKPGNYLRELSIVIIGIGVTLSAGNFVTSCNDRRELAVQMQAVYTELGENKVKLEAYLDHLDHQATFTYFLWRYTQSGQPIPKDSLTAQGYDQLIGIYPMDLQFKHNAYDLLLGSGKVLLIEDKKLLSTLGNCYADLAIIKESWENLNGMKQYVLLDLLNNDRVNFQDIDLNQPAWRGIRNYHLVFGGGRNFVVQTQRRLADILQTAPTR